MDQFYRSLWLVSMVFQILVRQKSLDDKRQIAGWKRIVSRFKGKLIILVKDVNGTFDDYSILPKIRQIVLHWGYELVENDLLWFIFCSYKNELLWV